MSVSSRLLLVGMLLLGVSVDVFGGPQGARLLPADEASRCRGFVAFRARLRGIIKRKDRAALLEIVEPDAMLSFGEAQGREDFKKWWLSDAPFAGFRLVCEG